MSKPFDAAAKSLIDADPLAWIRYFGMNGKAATVVDSDLNLPITADRLIRVSDPEYLAHFELQVSRDDEAEHRYSTYGAMPAQSCRYGTRPPRHICLGNGQAVGNRL